MDYSLYFMDRYIYKSPEYWAEWILAHYQDYSKKPLKNILSSVPIRDIVDYYYPYHEVDVTKSYRLFDSLMNTKINERTKYD